jgi:hypothetical protein
MSRKQTGQPKAHPEVSITEMSRRSNAVKNGEIPKISSQDLWAHQPGIEEKAILQLAKAYEMTRDVDYVSVSWENQEKALNYFNEHGLARTLNEQFRILAALPKLSPPAIAGEVFLKVPDSYENSVVVLTIDEAGNLVTLAFREGDTEPERLEILLWSSYWSFPDCERTTLDNPRVPAFVSARVAQELADLATLRVKVSALA